MPAQITTLINTLDNSEIVRDQIATILKLEFVAQQALAVTAALDPKLWEVRVFSERSNPWQVFLDPDGTVQTDNPPLVNVSVDNINYDGAKSNQVERQQADVSYHLDCYAVGIAEDIFGAGHLPGDERSAFECQRAVRLVRNILMSSFYTYLNLRGVVWGRRISSIQMFQPQIGATTVQQIVGGRISFEVGMNEFSPQYQAEILELIAVTVKRDPTGEILLTAHFDTT